MTYRSLTHLLMVLSLILLARGGAAETTCVPQMPQLAGLVSRWSGEGNADDARGVGNGKLQEATAFAAGKIGQAFRFDGVRDYVSMPFDVHYDFSPAGQFTLEAWVRPQPRNQFQAILTKSPPTGLWDWGLYLDNGGRFMAGLGSHHVVASTTVVEAGRWYYVAATYNNGDWQLYVNGRLESQATGTRITQSQGGLSLARKNTPPDVNNYDYYQGLIDEAGIYNRVLTAAEIQSSYKAGSQCAAPAPPAIAPNELNFSALIDGTDWVHIKGNKLWYTHGSWSLPGLYDLNNPQPTHINGKPWFPLWGTTLPQYTELSPPLPTSGIVELKLDVVHARGTVKIVQLPEFVNGYEAVILLDDSEGGFDWYSFRLTWSTKPNPTFTPGAGRIAFTSDRIGNRDIYVVDAQSPAADNGPLQLTGYAAEDAHPVWSPDGSKIAFHSDRDKNYEIYVMNADGSNQVRLTNNKAFDGNPAWSPDGKRITFHSDRDGSRQIYVMNADGSAPTRLGKGNSDDSNPAWSPDGKRIAFHSNREGKRAIYVMNSDGSNVVRLTAAGDDSAPVWSPDGKRIAFYSYRDGNYEIYVMNADGSNQTRLTNNTAADYEPAWSLDGRQIIFYSNRDGNSELYAMNADGTGQTRYTNNPARDESPSWGPVTAMP